jgi:sensor domain CHASE-containing protein
MKNEKKLCRIVNQSKARSYSQDPFWKFGILVPHTQKQVMGLDMKNNNKKWQDTKAKEMNQLLGYQTFLDIGKGGEAPVAYKKI